MEGVQGVKPTEIIGKFIGWVVVCALPFAALWLLATAMGCAADAVAALAM